MSSIRSMASMVGIAIGAALCPAVYAEDDADSVELSSRSARVAALGTPHAFAPELTRVDNLADSTLSRPLYRRSTESSTELMYRWWISRGRASLGFGVGTLSYRSQTISPQMKASEDGEIRSVADHTSLLMGLRFDATDRATFFADATSRRGLDRSSNDTMVTKNGPNLRRHRRVGISHPAVWHCAWPVMRG